MPDKTPSKLASGPLGPTSLFGTRRSQKVGSASAIIDACLAVLADELRPSIKNVHGAGRGFSERTLNRPKYKPILKAAQRRHEACLAGEWREGQPDDLTAMQKMVQDGYWVAGDQMNGTARGDVDPPELSLAQALALISQQRTVIDRQAREIQRRDDQLYHAASIAGQHGQTIARLREALRDLRGEIETLTEAPWSPRERQDWDEGDDG